MDRDAATVRHTAISSGDLAAGFPLDPLPPLLSSPLPPGILPSAKQDETFPSWERELRGGSGQERDGKRKREKSKVWWRKGKGRQRWSLAANEGKCQGVEPGYGVIFIATAPDVQ